MTNSRAFRLIDGDGHVIEVHEAGKVRADGVGLGLLEAQGSAIEAQGPLEVADADTEVGEGRILGVVHPDSLPDLGRWPRTGSFRRLVP